MNLRERKRPVDWPKQGLYFCLHHKVKVEYTHNIDERWDYQCAEKPYHELEVRLSAMRPVKGELPAGLTLLRAKLDAAEIKRDAARDERNAAWAKRNAAWDKLDAALTKYAPEIDALFAIECADVPWGDDGLIFPEEKDAERTNSI